MESIDHRPSVLSIHQGAGVSKKTKKGRNLSTKARRRQEKDQDRAAAIAERTEKKTAKSKGQARTIESRRKAWDDINNQIPMPKKIPQSAAADEDNSDQEEEVSEFDEEMDDAHVEKAKAKAFNSVAVAAAAAAAAATIDGAPANEAMDAYDGIL